MLVKKVEYTNAGESAVFVSHWEKERMKRLAKRLSDRSSARSSVKLLSSVTDTIKMFPSGGFAELVPKKFCRKRQYRSASERTVVETFCPQQFQNWYRKHASCNSRRKNAVQNCCPKR